MTCAFIIGCGPEAKDDYAEASYRRKGKPAITIAVNRAGQDLKFANHWVSLHSYMFEVWSANRTVLPQAAERWTASHIYTQSPAWHERRGIKHLYYPWDGTSSALGVFLAQSLGVKDIILCGVPLENGPHYYEGPDFTAADDMQRNWELAHRQGLLAGVTSMSGWTQRLLGFPQAG